MTVPELIEEACEAQYHLHAATAANFAGLTDQFEHHMAEFRRLSADWKVVS